jgi:histidinol-phosphate/aromatic aminotransferase/cobyric acid decarboxylase-like protein
LPGQIAAVTALAHPGYYVSKYAETRLMRGQCVAALRERTSVRIVESLVPAYLVRMPSRERAERAVELLESERIYVRSCTSFGAALERYVRVSVRSGTQNDVLVERIALLANAS